MIFLRRLRREQVHALGNLNEAFAAFAVFVAGSRDLDSQRVRTVEQRHAGRDIFLPAVDVKFDAHAARNVP